MKLTGHNELLKGVSEIEAFLDQHIFLGLMVKVEKNWRENERL